MNTIPPRAMVPRVGSTLRLPNTAKRSLLIETRADASGWYWIYREGCGRDAKGGCDKIIF
jgi:hypothetical protein